MHRMISPLPLLGSKITPSRTPHGQSKTLSTQEKRYVSNVERAVQNFDSIEEWADYIAVLSKLQKAISSNPDPVNINWIPYDFQISILLFKCISSSLPSGVHRKTIELYSTIFDILQPKNLSESISLWLPGILPLMSYASINVKSELIDLYDKYICSIDSVTLRSCFKSILLSLFPALDDTTSEFFNPTMDLIDKLKTQLNDFKHFWGCCLLCLITSSDKRVGAMEYLTRKLPSFVVSTENINNKDETLAKLSDDAISCLTPNSGLLIRAFCKAITDDNLFVQRGFFDLLLSKLPLHSAIYKYVIAESDKELLISNIIATVLRKDMSLNRRLWNWLLGPDSIDTNTKNHTTRLEYFQEYSLKYVNNSLLKLLTDKNDQTYIENYNNACRILIPFMDKWEIGQSILPKLFKTIFEKSKQIQEINPEEFENVSKFSNELFDGLETNLIWSNILSLIKYHQTDLVIFILKTYNVQDDDMLLIHIPYMLLASIFVFNYEPESIELTKLLFSFIPQRAFGDPNSEIQLNIIDKLTDYYESEGSTLPFDSNELSTLILNKITEIMLQSTESSNTFIFFEFTKIFDDLVKSIPNSNTWQILKLKHVIYNYVQEVPDIYFSLGICTLFKYLKKDTHKIETLKTLKITIDALWNCLKIDNGKYQVEIAQSICKLDKNINSCYIEAAICKLLLEVQNFSTRIKYFNLLWVHLNDDNYNESKSILHRPLYLILNELNNEIYAPIVTKWIKTTVNTDTLNTLFQMICSDLFNNNQLLNIDKEIETVDFKQIFFDLNVIFQVLSISDEIMQNFKLEFCVIDNDKQIEFIKSRGREISTYKSFLIIILFKIMELNNNNTNANLSCFFNSEDYLNCINITLKTLTLLVDGNEPDFNKIIEETIEACTINTYRDTQSYYLTTLMKFIHLSSKKSTMCKIFSNESSETILLFITTGIFKNQKVVEFSEWNDLIMCMAEYYPDLVYHISNGIIECICSQLEELINNKEYFCTMDECICELILGMEKILTKCHKHLGYMLSDNFSFGNTSTSLGKNINHNNLYGVGSNNSNNNSLNANGSNNKDVGFFGSVIQGVFQVEPVDEKNEIINRKNHLIGAFQRSIKCMITTWNMLNDSMTENRQSKSINYCCNKIKFRCKKLMENNYYMEPLETIESMISCYSSSNNKNTEEIYKMVQILDDSTGKVSILYILDGIITRMNYSGIEENRRSSLSNILDIKDIFEFLIGYINKVKDIEKIEEIWNDVNSFIKDVTTNTSFYKSMIPFILRFYNSFCIKILRSEFGKSKRINKELSESFLKLINLCITVKTAIITSSGSTQKIIFREEVCFGLQQALPNLNKILNDNDKINIVVNSIISGVSAFIFKNINEESSELFNRIPKYLIDLIQTMSLEEPFYNNKNWKHFCLDIINNDEFFKNKTNRKEWDYIMKNWIEYDENRIEEYLNKMVISNGVSNSSTLLFNWNDEVDILNGNIEYIKRIIYLINNCKKDRFVSFIGIIIDKLDEYFKLFRQITKDCLLEKYMILLIRVTIVKFNENNLDDLWSLVDKEILYLFMKGYDFLEALSNEVNEVDFGEKKKKNLETDNFEDFNDIFLQGCKLIDVLIIYSPEEFQLSEWIYINDNMDGIYSFKDSNENIERGNVVGIIEKISKLRGGNSSVQEKETETKNPLLLGIQKIGHIKDLKWFFNTLRIHKYEEEYELKEIDENVVVDDIFNDI